MSCETMTPDFPSFCATLPHALMAPTAITDGTYPGENPSDSFIGGSWTMRTDRLGGFPELTFVRIPSKIVFLLHLTDSMTTPAYLG